MINTNDDRPNLSRLKDIAAQLRLNQPDLAVEVERAIDDLMEAYEILGVEAKHDPEDTQWSSTLVSRDTT